MGHAEMLLAVAGLKSDEVKALTKKLSVGDWSDFPKAQQTAFALAYKLTKDPASFTEKDREAVIQVFGVERATDLIWYVAWSNYMTRVADAFQLPLEKENCFMPPPKNDPPAKKETAPKKEPVGKK